tara:strand:- start:1645 stop:2340 length:696 start_codon:yes stop_codon:yes gene_type:complete
MSFLSSLGGSVLRGGLIKGAIKGLIKGTKAGAGKIVKGFKRGGKKIMKGIKKGIGNISLGARKLGAQIKALPDSFTRAKSAAFPKKPQVMGITKKGKVMITKAPVGRSFKEQVDTFFKQLTRWQKRAGDKVVRKEQANRIAKVLDKVMRNEKKWEKVVKQLKPNDTFMSRATQRVLGAIEGGKQLIKTMLKEGAENVTVDQTFKMAGVAGLGLTGAAISGATTGAVIESKK